MRQALSVILTLAILPGFAAAAPDTSSVTTQITAMSVGTNIELHLNNKERLRGARGAASDSGFTLVNPRAGDRQVAFNDVASVKLYVVKSHTTRNILIGVGIAAAALAITIAILLRCGPLGCHPTQSAVPISVHF
jgi:hypothetical protein